MPKKKKTLSKNELERRLALCEAANISSSITKIVRTLFRCCGFAAPFYCGYLIVDSLAGKFTVADIDLSGLYEMCSFNFSVPSDMKFNIALWISTSLLGISGLWYGRLQGSARRKIIASKHDRVKELEKLIDLNRSGSGLTTTGDTPGGSEI